MYVQGSTPRANVSLAHCELARWPSGTGEKDILLIVVSQSPGTSARHSDLALLRALQRLPQDKQDLLDPKRLLLSIMTLVRAMMARGCFSCIWPGEKIVPHFALPQNFLTVIHEHGDLLVYRYSFVTLVNDYTIARKVFFRLLGPAWTRPHLSCGFWVAESESAPRFLSLWPSFFFVFFLIEKECAKYEVMGIRFSQKIGAS